MEIEKLYYSFSDLENDLADINHQMNLGHFRPDIVIGPGRGAYVPGVMLSHYWGIPFKGFEWQTRDGSQKNENQLKEILNTHVHDNILLVDDINDTGHTLNTIHEVFYNDFNFSDLRTATLFSKATSEFKDVDFFARELSADYDPWIVFPYEEWWK